MKLASYKDGSRDGQLVVVSRDLSAAHYAAGIATRLQQVLDDWNFVAPQLQELQTALDAGQARHAFAFDPRRCMAPLARPFHCLRARGAGPTADGEGPALVGGDPVLGPRDEFIGHGDAPGVVVTPALAAVTGDVCARADAAQALEGVRLLMLSAIWQPLTSVPGDDDAAEAEGWRTLAFGPVAVTPDECGAAWRHGGLRLGLQLGAARGAGDHVASFGELLVERLRHGSLHAGAVLVAPLVDAAASTTVVPAQGIEAASLAVVASQRSIRLAAGDTAAFSLIDAAGHAPLGRIEQRMAAWPGGGQAPVVAEAGLQAR